MRSGEDGLLGVWTALSLSVLTVQRDSEQHVLVSPHHPKAPPLNSSPLGLAAACDSGATRPIPSTLSAPLENRKVSSWCW